MKNREDIKNILEMNISNQEKKNLIANLKNYKTLVGRAISVDLELNLEEGQIWDNKGFATSWSDRNDENGEAFNIETEREVNYILKVEGELKGYKVQYLSYDNLFEEFFYEKDMDETEAEELADEISSDKVYEELMNLLGSDGDMKKEAEILIPAETKLQIKEINDGREDVGYIEVILEEIK